MDVYDELAANYGIDDLAVISYEQRIHFFTQFLEKVLDCDEFFIPPGHQKIMRRYLSAARNYLSGETSEQDLEQLRIECWHHYDAAAGLVQALYRVIVICLYSRQANLDDSTDQGTMFSLYIELLEDCGQSLPNQFYTYMLSRL